MNFNNLVEEIITPALNGLGFVLTKDDKNLMRFDSDAIRVKIGYDSFRGGELIFCVSDDINEFTLTDITEAFGIRKSIPIFSMEENTVRKGLVELRKLLLAHKGLLLGDLTLWTTLYRRKQMKISDYNYLLKTNDIKARLNDAWEKKDYKTFVKIVADSHIRLDNVLRKKFDIAFKNING